MSSSSHASDVDVDGDGVVQLVVERERVHTAKK